MARGSLAKSLVKDDLQRFPNDFMGSTPRAVTEQGIAMLSSVLHAKRAIAVNVEVMRAFVRLRRLHGEHADLVQRISELESRFDRRFRLVFDAIRALQLPAPDEERGPIGFRPDRLTLESRPRLPHRHMYGTLDDLPWTDKSWLATVNAWIDGEVAKAGLTPAGPREQPHVRPWSTVLRVPTNDGDLYFKAVWPPQAHEAPLTAALSSWLPRFTPEVVAVRPEAGWLLLRDAGLRLREILKKEHDVARWREVLVRYAEAQVELADRTNAILDLGVPDRRPAVVAEHLAELLEDSRALRLGLPDGLSADEHERVRALLPRIRSQFAALADSSVPATLEHNDFHDGNVCLSNREYRVFDWGDACVTHPFVSLRVGLRSIAHTLDLAADGPEIARLRDAYLEPWTAFASRTQLLTDVQPALILAAACRAFSWRLVVNELDPPLLDEWADTVAYSVRSMLELGEAALT